MKLFGLLCMLMTLLQQLPGPQESGPWTEQEKAFTKFRTIADSHPCLKTRIPGAKQGVTAFVPNYKIPNVFTVAAKPRADGQEMIVHIVNPRFMNNAEPSVAPEIELVVLHAVFLANNHAEGRARLPILTVGSAGQESVDVDAHTIWVMEYNALRAIWDCAVEKKLAPLQNQLPEIQESMAASQDSDQLSRDLAFLDGFWNHMRTQEAQTEGPVKEFLPFWGEYFARDKAKLLAK